MNPIAFGVWLCCSGFKNKFLSKLILLQNFLEFLELSSLFSPLASEKKMWLLGRKLWCEKLRFQLILFLWRSEAHFPFISYMTLHPTSLTFQLITFFPNPCPLGNRFLLLQESSAAFYNCSDYFKYLWIMKTSSYYGNTWCSSEGCFLLCLQAWSWPLGISREFCQ